MLDFSIAELGMATVVALLVLKPKDIKELVRWWCEAIMTARTEYQKYTANLHQEIETIIGEEKQVAKKSERHYIIDLEGRLQETYNLDDIMPLIKEKKPDVEK